MLYPALFSLMIFKKKILVKFGKNKISYFKVNNSVAFGTFTMLYNHHLFPYFQNTFSL